MIALQVGHWEALSVLRKGISVIELVESVWALTEKAVADAADFTAKDFKRHVCGARGLDLGLRKRGR